MTIFFSSRRKTPNQSTSLAILVAEKGRMEGGKKSFEAKLARYVTSRTNTGDLRSGD